MLVARMGASVRSHGSPERILARRHEGTLAAAGRSARGGGFAAWLPGCCCPPRSWRMQAVMEHLSRSSCTHRDEREWAGAAAAADESSTPVSTGNGRLRPVESLVRLEANLRASGSSAWDAICATTADAGAAPTRQPGGRPSGRIRCLGDGGPSSRGFIRPASRPRVIAGNGRNEHAFRQLDDTKQLEPGAAALVVVYRSQQLEKSRVVGRSGGNLDQNGLSRLPIPLPQDRPRLLCERPVVRAAHEAPPIAEFDDRSPVKSRRARCRRRFSVKCSACRKWSTKCVKADAMRLGCLRRKPRPAQAMRGVPDLRGGRTGA
jgi:hypothetical protein